MFAPVRGKTMTLVSESPTKRTDLQDASEFFVHAFWTAKVGGGSPQLTTRQTSQLLQSQQAEFTRRYGSTNTRRRYTAEFFVLRNAQNQIIACAGVELDQIRAGSRQGPVLDTAPLMSNLAVSRSYRRRGLAEELVKAVERHCKYTWGYTECYLYVEERNKGAVKLYQKLGYRTIWKDTEAQTLLPTDEGSLQQVTTTLLCMRKNLNGGFWNLFG
jgi:ribosomal protein S18 acetylase RimI-like enzyme